MPLEIANPLGGRALSLRAMLERQRVQVLRCADGGTLTVTGTVPRSITRRRVEILGTASVLALSQALRRATAFIAGAAVAALAALILRRASVEAEGQAETVARSQAIRRASAVIAGGATVIGVSETPEPFDPLDLFGSGEAGGLYYVHPDTVWADTAGTTPASVDGAVARIDDVSGNGNHLLQASASLRPVLRQSGAVYYLEFDGTDDVLVRSSPSGLASVSAFSAYVAAQSSNTDFRGVFAAGNADGIGSGDRYFHFRPTTSSSAIRGPSASITVAFSRSVLTDYVVGYEVDCAAGGWSAYADGSAHSSGGQLVGAFAMSNHITAGASRPTLQYLQGRWYGAVLVNRLLTSGEREGLQTWLGAVQGRAI